MEQDKPVKYFSTFTGVGGFEIGIQRAIPGAVCVGFSEIDKHSNKVLRYRFKGVKNYGDITRINEKELPDFDILCGGFPCQPFSIAGKRMGFKDTRGTLFHDLARIAACKKPSILFFENVKGLLSHEEGRTITAILKTLDELGYDAEWQLLNSKHFGVPQNRERIIIVGHLRGKPRLQVFPIPKATRINTGQSKGKEVVHGTLTTGLGRQGSSSEYISSLNKIGEANKLKEVTPPGTSQWNRVYDAEGVASTLTCAGSDDSLYQVKEKVVCHSLQTRNADRPSLKKNPKAGGSGHISKVEESYCLDTGSTQAIEIRTKASEYIEGNRTKEPVMIDLYNNSTSKDTHPTLTPPHNNMFLGQETRIRRLTPTECERLQGFPDNWTQYGLEEDGTKVVISDNQRYKMMGNAVTTNVIECVAGRICKALCHRDQNE